MRQLAEKLELNSHDKVLAEARALEREKEEVRAEKDRQEEAYITQVRACVAIILRVCIILSVFLLLIWE